MLEAFLAEVKAGTAAPTKMMILWFSETEDRLKPHRWFAGMTHADEIALLELAKQIGLEDWKN